MQRLASRQLLEFTNQTLKRSTNVAELWAGTLYETQIENDKLKVIESLKKDDEEKIRQVVNSLAQFVDQAENEFLVSDER